MGIIMRIGINKQGLWIEQAAGKCKIQSDYAEWWIKRGFCTIVYFDYSCGSTYFMMWGEDLEHNIYAGHCYERM